MSPNETTAVLVAIAAANQLTNTKHLRKATYPPQHHKKTPKIDERTARILDALSTVLIEAPRDEVAAVGVQADYGTPGDTTVTIAMNTDVPQATEAHLKQIWNALAALSGHYREEQKKGKKLTKQTFAGETPKKLRDEPLPPQYYSLSKLVYSYSFLKFSRRLKKRHNKTVTVCEKLIQRCKSGEVQRNKTLESLIYILVNLHSLHGCDRSMMQRDTFVKKMTAVFFYFQELQRESETGELTNILGPSFEDTWRFMEKGLEFQTAIMDLDGLAASRRMSPILRGNLKVNRLPANETEELPSLPSLISDWRAAAHGIVKQLETTDKFGPCLKKAHEKHQGRRGLVHSEIKIFEHFVTRPADSIPPLGYIGVSKPSCLGCWTTINAWNNTHDAPKFSVRGTQGKWYFPWAAPTKVAEDGLAVSRIHDDLQEEVINCLKQYDLCRIKSDSSVNSSHSQWTSYSVTAGEARDLLDSLLLE